METVIAYCGLYCSQCGKFKNGKCPGCQKNEKASWCKIRSCNMQNNYQSCADCKTLGVENCKDFNHPIGKIFGIIFNSDRKACIQLIKDEGYEQYAVYMDSKQQMSIKRRGKR